MYLSSLVLIITLSISLISSNEVINLKSTSLFWSIISLTYFVLILFFSLDSSVSNIQRIWIGSLITLLICSEGVYHFV